MPNIYDSLKAATTPLMGRFKNPKGVATWERYTDTPNGSGGFSTSWATQGTFNIIIIPASAEEKIEAQRINTQVSHKILALYDDAVGITSKDRLSFDGRFFNVEYPLDIAEGEMWYKMMCMEGVAT